MSSLNLFVLILFFCNSHAIYLNTTNSKKFENNPAIWTEEGLWGPMLEEWAIGKTRVGKVMQLSSSNSAYNIVEEKIDKNVTEDDKRESKINNGKIVSNSSNNNNKKPQTSQRQVSETDLYLLGAIEKLVYRVDFLEKRLRRVEEMLYYVMAGNRVDQEPCPDNYTRIGSNCYAFSNTAGREYDWKVASKQCKKLGAKLAEMENIEEYQDVIAYIQTNSYLIGKDFWTGGLNPGLLWIWSNSARPVIAPGSQNNNKNPSAAIQGDGRCLRLAYNPALRAYSYKGTDCSVRYSYICELPENSSSNEIRRLGRSKNIF